LLEEPVTMLFNGAQREGGAKQWKRGHEKLSLN
jgi:hypothetical protein